MSTERLKVAFFGTPSVASDTFALLHLEGYVPDVVVTNPDRKQGRGMELTPSPTKTWADNAKIPVLAPQRLTPEAIAEIVGFGCDYAIVVAYGKIFPQELIGIFPKGVINIHYSLLPKYRGASPVETALLNDEKTTGVTVQKMAFKLDAGDVIATKEVAIEHDDTALTLRPRLIQAGAELLIATLPSYLCDEIKPVPQDGTKAVYARKIQKEERELDIQNGDALQNWLKYRAYAEAPGTHFFTQKDGKRMRVKIIQAEYQDGTFVILRVVPEGKKEMDYRVFTNGT